MKQVIFDLPKMIWRSIMCKRHEEKEKATTLAYGYLDKMLHNLKLTTSIVRIIIRF